MIILIDPKRRQGNIKLINEMLMQYQKQYGIKINVDELSQATFIIAYEKHRGIIGGGWLTQKQVNAYDLTPEQFYLLENLTHYWECSGVNFSLDDADPAYLHPSSLYSLKCSFYENLYECLINFGIVHDTNFVVLRNHIDEHEHIRFFGNWPMKRELLSSHNLHEVWSVVPITMASQDIYQQRYDLRARHTEWINDLSNELNAKDIPTK